MKGLQVKIMTMVLAMIMIMLIIPVNVFAAPADTQVNIQAVKQENGDYIIYVQNLANKEFQFAISDTNDLDSDSMELIKIKATKDGAGNNVALIKQEQATGNYLYIMDEDNVFIANIDYNEALEKTTMEQVEKITNKIKTNIIDIVERNEVIDEVTYIEEVGALEIKDDENAKYEYVISAKLPVEKYSTLKELTDKLNNEYESKDMYSKIEIAKEYNKIFEELVNDATAQNIWKTVENMQIKQPSDAQDGDQYVILLKKVAQDGTITYDTKIMTSFKVSKEEKIPASTQTRTVKETAKLPITGESIAIFVALAIIVIAMIVVFARMKKLQKSGKH